MIGNETLIWIEESRFGGDFIISGSQGVDGRWTIG